MPRSQPGASLWNQPAPHSGTMFVRPGPLAVVMREGAPSAKSIRRDCRDCADLQERPGHRKSGTAWGLLAMYLRAGQGRRQDRDRLGELKRIWDSLRYIVDVRPGTSSGTSARR